MLSLNFLLTTPAPFMFRLVKVLRPYMLTEITPSFLVYLKMLFNLSVSQREEQRLRVFENRC